MHAHAAAGAVNLPRRPLDLTAPADRRAVAYSYAHPDLLPKKNRHEEDEAPMQSGRRAGEAGGRWSSAQISMHMAGMEAAGTAVAADAAVYRRNDDATAFASLAVFSNAGLLLHEHERSDLAVCMSTSFPFTPGGIGRGWGVVV